MCVKKLSTSCGSWVKEHVEEGTVNFKTLSSGVAKMIGLEHVCSFMITAVLMRTGVNHTTLCAEYVFII